MIKEHHLKIERTARYFSLGEPSDAVEEVWFVLHGYGFLGGGFLSRFESLQRPERLIIAPEALNRFYLRGFFGKVGATWMTKEDRLSEIEDYVGYLDKLAGVILSELGNRDRRVVVLGFSQGTATAGRWLSMGEIEADRLIIWAGGLPPDLDYVTYKQKLNSSRLTLVYGTNDEYLSAKDIDAEKTRLTALGLKYDVYSFDGGHDIEPDLLARITDK